MRIAIVEDDIHFAETAEKAIKDFFAARKEAAEIRLLGCTDLLDEMSGQRSYDLYLLDVEMPGMNGMELAERIRFRDRNARIVFLTSYEKYALQGIRIGVYYYILKDSYQEELCLILERICREEEERREDYYVILTKRYGSRVRMDNILYLTKEKKYTFFQCLNGAMYSERDSMENVFRRLPEKRFMMINKGIAVNMKHVVQFAKLEVVMRDGTVLPVSRQLGPSVRDKLADYWGEGQ